MPLIGKRLSRGGGGGGGGGVGGSMPLMETVREVAHSQTSEMMMLAKAEGGAGAGGGGGGDGFVGDDSSTAAAAVASTVGTSSVADDSLSFANTSTGMTSGSGSGSGGGGGGGAHSTSTSKLSSTLGGGSTLPTVSPPTGTSRFAGMSGRHHHHHSHHHHADFGSSSLRFTVASDGDLDRQSSTTMTRSRSRSQWMNTSKNLSMKLRMEEIKGNRLHIYDLGLHGRDEEVDLLKSHLSSLVDTMNEMIAAEENKHEIKTVNNNKPEPVLSEETKEEGGKEQAAAAAVATPPNGGGGGNDDVKSDQPNEEEEQKKTAGGSQRKVQIGGGDGGEVQSPPPSTTQLKKREVILLKGYSGTGKTALAQQTLQKLVRKHYHGLYISGKYDLYIRDEPYYGIASACRGICGELLLLQRQEEEEEKKVNSKDDTTTVTSASTTSSSSKTHNNKSKKKKRSFRKIHDQLLKELGISGIQVLATIVPEITEIITYEEYMMTAATDDTTTGGGGGGTTTTTTTTGGDAKFPVEADEAFNQGDQKAKLQQFFRVFMRIIAQHFGPIVMVLDDLQWADYASLDLMDVLVTDSALSGLMLVGLYRSNEVSESHLLSKTIVDLKEKATSLKDRCDFVITEIEVTNLNLSSVKSIVMHALSLDDTPGTQELAEICYKRTQGNVFFLITFITHLEEEGLVEFNLNLHYYTWDIERIKSETGATSNVVDLMTSKMVKLSKEMQSFLSVAACLGSSFDPQLLNIPWTALGFAASSSTQSSNGESKSNDIMDMLTIAIQEGLLEALDLDDDSAEQHAFKFRWIHDKVQEAAFTLIPKDDVEDFKFGIGAILCERLSEEELKESIFLVANLLNERPVDALEATQRILLSELNLQAVEKAFKFSAFGSAANYAEKGILLLPEDKWTSHSQLTLDLYSSATEANELIGNPEKMNEYCEEVLKQDSIPIINKLRVYNVKISHMGGAHRNYEALDLIIDVLAQLGCKFSKFSPSIQIMAGLIRTKSTIKSRTSRPIEEMPIIKDKLQAEIIQMLDRLTIVSYHCGNNEVFLMTVLRIVKLTYEQGICRYCPAAFATLGLIIGSALDDYEGGSKIAEYALQILEKVKSIGAYQCRTNFVTYCYVIPWTKPIHYSMKKQLEAYQFGLAEGDNENAMFAILVYIILANQSGQKLSLIVSDCANYSRQMKDLKREICTNYVLLFWQYALNLMGHSENTTVIQGEIIESAEDFFNMHHEIPPMMAMIRTCEARLYVVFNEHEKCAKLFSEHGYDWPKAGPGHPMFMEMVFCGGLSCFEMARNGSDKKQRGKYKKLAMKAHSTISNWMSKGNPNVKHYAALLEAEKDALKGKQLSAEKNYQSAVAMAARGGFVQDTAIANERYGQYLLSVSDENGAKFHINKCIGYYKEWGASKKVELLLNHDFTELWGTPTGMTSTFFMPK